MIATFVIVLREVVEAGLIVGIVLAAVRGVPRRGRWIAGGVACGVAGACLVASFAGELADLFEGAGQELFNAAVLLLAVAMLTSHTVWMARRGRAVAQELRTVGAAVADGRRSLAAVAIACAVAVLREGVEVVLFLYGVATAGGSSAAGMVAGGLLGIAAGAGISALMYFGLLNIPARRLFAVTAGLITLIAAGLASQAISFLRQAGYLTVLSAPVWDSSGLLSVDGVIGRLLHTLMGYTDRPSGLQLVAYILTIAATIWLTRLAPARRAAAATPPAPAIVETVATTGTKA